MKKVLLMDMFSTIHVGNGALLENTIKLCKAAWGDCRFDIITLDKKTNSLKYSADRLHSPMFGKFWFGQSGLGKSLWATRQALFMLLQILNELTFRVPSEKLTFSKEQKDAVQAINDSDICVSSSGEMISDTFYQMLPFWLFTYWLASKKGKKLIVFPQTIGPLKMGWTRALVKLALKDATIIAGRDEESYNTLLSLGLSREVVMFVPDVAIQQEIGDADINRYLPNREKKVIGITISNPPKREKGTPLDFVEEVGKQVEKLDPKQYQILIMPSNYQVDGISKDYSLCMSLQERLRTQFDTSILENRAYFPDEYTSLLSQLELFISTRMHVAILATSIGTPTIAINTQHKIRGYMQNIKAEHFCVEYSEMDRIAQLAGEILQNPKEVSEHLKGQNELLRRKHKPFVERLTEVDARQA
ncbi:polysaccharide pyruvyl transferase family protein [Marinobacter flavimaris]|uniref:Polysaccharide pyruvyl transferase family protein n=1 Tax=Marinobacter flavimaris TaxID=262076 RepID=A0A3D8H6L7_9GAMM|nr:polysaccharide pyruvyl transferase family protein [Marinobacter flavimaris]PPI81932.1 hypothetical protein MDHKLMBL_01485 [Marinobacter flavimaris]RDU42383.1 polysaccharide pyruvyl transferase family protein [Marinobacter flavimaris]